MVFLLEALPFKPDDPVSPTIMIVLKQPKVLVLNPPVARSTRRKKFAFLAFRAAWNGSSELVISPSDVGQLNAETQSAGSISAGEVAVRVVQVLEPGKFNPTVNLPHTVEYPYFAITPT